jgi:hypothetical protein
MGRGPGGLRFRVSGGGAGRIYMVSLQQGLTWAPNYQVEILDGKRLRFTAKATILNDLADLRDAEVRLVTGFPNVPYAGLPDPLTSPTTVSQFVNLVSGVGRERNAANDAGGNPLMSGGGFGGAGGFAGGRTSEMISRPGQRPPNLAPAAVGPSLTGEQVEDLFFYSRPNTTLGKGERAYATLFQAETPYDRRYVWKVDKEQQPDFGYDWYYQRIGNRIAEFSPDVWDTVEFKNLSGQPISTGVGVLTSEGRLLGQSVMPYTPKGGEAEMRVNKALDVTVDYGLEDVADEPANDNHRAYFLRRGTLTVRNGKAETVKMRIEKRILGELDKSDLPMEKRTYNSRDYYWYSAYGWYAYGNTLQELTWTPEVKSGATLTFSFTYRVYR